MLMIESGRYVWPTGEKCWHGGVEEARAFCYISTNENRCIDAEGKLWVQQEKRLQNDYVIVVFQ